MQLQILNDFPLPRIGASAPTEIVLFNWGENLTTKGTKYLTKSGANQIMATYNQGGRILNIDLDHSTFDKSVRPQDRFSVGHFRLALKDIGIVATDIQWVDGWDEKISRGEWTFFSPAVMETAEGEIVSIRNIALTNLPATQNQTPLCLSDIETMRQAETQPKIDIIKNQSLLSRTKPAKDMLAAIGSCMTSAQSAMSADSTLKEAAAELIAALPTVTDKINKILQEMDPQGDTMETEKDEQLSAHKQIFELASELTGKTDPDEIKGSLLALKQTQKMMVTQLSDAHKDVASALIDQGITDKLIAPNEKNTFLQMFSDGKINTKGLKTYLEDLRKNNVFTELKEKIEPIKKIEISEEKKEENFDLDSTVSSIFARVPSR